MSAKDYPITFGYGATDDTYYGPKAAGKPTYIGPYHRGDDRAMPYGTPVIVNGVTIGESGDGNGRYGAHLHIGKFVNGGDTNPGGGGFSLDGALVVDIVDNYAIDPVNAKYVRIQDSNGSQWVYLHMSAINVKIGQELKGNNMPYIEQSDLDDLNAWKRTGQALANDPAYEAMGGKVNGGPLQDTSGIGRVLDDFRIQKTANQDAQPYKKFVTDSPYWGGQSDLEGTLQIIPKGGTPPPVEDSEVNILGKGLLGLLRTLGYKKG